MTRDKLFLISILLMLFPQLALAQWFSHEFEVMGTKAKVEFEHSDKKQGKRLISAVVEEMNRIDFSMSPYKPKSELSRVNNEAVKEPIKISKELFELLKRSIEFSKMTSGAFDVTFSSIGYLYDFRKGEKPSEAEIKELKSSINYKNIRFENEKQTVYFHDNRIKIDLGGIGKGHAVDRSIKVLSDAGVKNAFVSAGGDSRIIGKKNDRLWYIGVKHPRDPDKLLVNLPLENVSVSTSGDYERFFIDKDGTRYHHIINPKTGDSAREVQSVTILADDSTTADALSTSVFILGVEKGMKLINGLEAVSAIIVDKHGKLFISNDLAPAS